MKKSPKTSVSDITNHLHWGEVKVSQSIVRRRLRDQGYRGYTTWCKPLISSTNRKARLHLAKKYRATRVLWTDETKMNVYQSDGKAKEWRKKGSPHDQKHSSSVKHGGGSVYQTLSVIYFLLLKYSLFQYLFSPKKCMFWYLRGYVVSSLANLGVNTRK